MKKRFVLGMLIVGVAMAFVACKGPVAGAPVASGEEIDVEPEEEPDIWLETEVVMPDIDVLPEDEMVKLTYEELEYFDYGFFNRYETEDQIGLPHSNMFLTSEYYTPLDIDMKMLFYDGIYGEPSIDVTEEERRLLVERYGTDILEYGEPTRIPVDSMNAVLKRYTGLTLEQTNKVGLTRYYLEEYQSYYSVNGDVAWIEIGVIDGWKNAKGTVVIKYVSYFDDEIWHAILHEVNGQYYFAANIKISPKDDPEIEGPELENDVMYPY